MELYLYSARDILTQKKTKGEMEGESEEAVRKALAEKNLYPEMVKRKNALNSDIQLFKQKIKLDDINFFCKQFAAMIQAGISVAKGLEICAKQTPNKTLSAHLNHIHEQVNEGKTLSQAVEEEKIFPDLLVNLIACGEDSGNLDEVMRRAVEHFDNQLGIRKKVKKALTYPILVMCLIVVVVCILMIKVVPAYMGLLNDTGANIPLPTKIVIAVSDFFIAQWPVMLAVAAGVAIVCLNIKKIPGAKEGLDKVKIKLPLFGNLIRQSLSATFSSTLSMLVQSGIPMLQAMEITKNVMNNAVAEKEMQEAMDVLKQGNSLLTALSNSRIFPPILLSMVSIGEESGALDEMLVKISAYFKEEVEITVENLTMLIEPVMIIMVAVIVGGIMAAIMLPTFSAATAVM